MINVSDAFKEELNNDNRNYLCYVDIELTSGPTIETNLQDTTDQYILDVNDQEIETLIEDRFLHLENKDIWSGSLSIEESVSNESSFDIGSTVINKATLVINNIYEEYTSFDFVGAKVTIKIGLNLSSGSIETINKGIFYVDSAKYNGALITLECLDSMSKFDKDYSKSTLTYPATLRQIVQDACSVCDVLYSAAAFDNDDYIVEERPSDESLTFRQMLNYVGQIACQQFSIDHNDRLIARWYDRDMMDELYENPESVDESDYHHISSINSQSIDMDDVVITGIRVVEFSEDSENPSGTYLYGEEGYILEISDNKLIPVGKGNEVSTYLGQKLVGMRFRPMEITFQNDPTIEPVDIAKVVDYKGNRYYTFITSTNFTAGNSQTLSCGAESATRNSASRYSEATKAYTDSKNLVEHERTEREKAVEALQDTLKNSSGMYITEEEQPDGSTITYLHDKPTLEESQNVIKITAEAIGISNDGGETYPYGLFLTGDLIARLLYVVGINADYINSGAITISDNDGEVTFYADTVTGRVEIRAETLTITGKTVQEIAAEQSDSKINDFVDAVYNPGMENLQAQIDGQIETWFYNYVPTASNYPASEWTTDAEKDKHLGDLFYIVDNAEYGGQAYRWAKINNVYQWDYVEDTAVTKALADAAQAKDTADQKRRVFISTPTPPYDVGDLWVQGNNGDIMRCQTARQSGNYNSSDWVKASKYTDDSYAEEVKQDLQNQINNINNLILQLSNEIISVATDYNGLNGEYSECYTNAYLYIGNDDITNDTSVVWTATASSGVSGSWSEELKRYTVTNMTGDNGSVDITASYNGITVTKTFSVSKSKAGAPGVEGPPGDDGRTLYTWIKYADSPTSGMSDDPTNKKYMGIAYNKISPDKSTNYSDYAWSLIEGEGVAGPPGKNGETLYTWIKYATSADGDNITDSPESRTYIGFAYNKTSPIESTNPNDYTWSLIQGEPGRVYMLQASVQVMVLGYDNVFSPPSVTFSSYYRNGGDAERSEYSGRFVIKEVSDNGVYQTKYTSSRDEASITYTPSGTNVKNIQCTLYTSGGTSQSLDVQSVAVAKDVDNISQQEMFNILTNNGEIAGIFMRNGQLYINASYVKSGTLDTDVLDVDDIFSKNVKATGTISGATITGASGEFTKYFKVNVENGSIIVQQNITSEGLAIGVLSKDQSVQEFINAIYLYETGMDITSDNNILLSSNENTDIQSGGDVSITSFGGTVYINGASYDPVTVNPGCFNKCGHVATVNAWGDAALGIIRTLDASWRPAYGNAVASGWCYNTSNRIYYPCVCKWDTSGNPTAYAIATFGEVNNNYVIYQSGTDRRSTFTLFITGTWIVN